MTLSTQEKRMVNFNQIYIPIAMVASLAFFVWFASAERTHIHGRIDKVILHIEQLTETVQKLTKDRGSLGTNYMTKKDLENWCLRHQILNPNWKCAFSP